MKSLRDLFTYSANERYGLIVLIFLLMAVSGYNIWLARHVSFPHEPAEASGKSFPVADSMRPVSLEKKYKSATYGSRDRSYASFHPDKYKRTLEMNTADSAGFEHLPGIGGILARRIIRYRTLLGGFYDSRQLTEVYGISDSVYMLICSRLQADTSKIARLNLNEADEKTMARHPYIGKYVAAGIVKYRETKGRIKDLNEITNNGLVEKDQMERLKFYVFL